MIITNILAIMTKMSILSSWKMGVTFIPLSCLKGIVSVQTVKQASVIK